MTISLPGYRFKAALYEGTDSLIYRGQHLADGQAVILKLLKHDYPSPEQIAWFKREYELMQALNLSGVIKVSGLECLQNRWAMILEDFGGESLERLGYAGHLPLADFLKLAVQITETLGQVHQQRLIHKDINPTNIVLNPTTGQVKLIDFGIATPLSRENPTFRNPDILEGTLPYLSPEQTGRMNRAMDYRTDFYSLGVTFYELLTGQLPFLTTDPLELLYCHIAKPPRPLHELKPEIPEMLSRLVLKLMAKNAEDRYQSAYGLKLDLEECLWLWQSTHQIRLFSLGRQDVPDQFQISQKLYGREPEITALLAAFERVGAPQGKSELMLVSGLAGIGKSALVQEVYKPLTGQRGYFIAGKYDQFQRNNPYTALIRAFQTLIHQLLTESEARIARWRERLLAALNPNGQLLVEVIPELALIIGPQEPVPALGPAEAQNRFNLTFQRFIQLFAQPEHPLVIFLDDLQWADEASLKLLELLMTDPTGRHLFLIGAYRDNEVGEVHPLRLTLARIEQAGTRLTGLHLAPLALDHITQLIADTLHRRPQSAQSLATLVLAKTGGNPFFVNEFLKSLYAEGFLSFNFQRGSWQWNLEQIQNQGITDNIVDFMAGRLLQLSPEAQETLKLVACLGSQFDLETVAIISGKSQGAAAVDLWEALAEGLILPLSDNYRLMTLNILELNGEAKIEYKFAHDRIQQAAYELLTETERGLTHRRIGRLLLRNIPLAKQAERIFDIVNPLNMSISWLDDPGERQALAELNLLAGRRAKASAAYEAAARYLQVGLGLLAAGSWRQTYPLALNLHTEAAEAAYLTGDFAEMERLVKLVLGQARNLLDQVKLYEIKIQAHIAQHQLLEAVDTALSVLALLGLHLPRYPGKWHMVPALLQTRLYLMGKSMEELVSQPEMADPYKLATLRILSTLHTAAYFAVPELVPLEVCARVNLTVKHGHAPASAFAYADYGMLITAVWDKIDLGYEFGQLALALLQRRESRAYKARTLLVVNTHIRHWREHARETLPALLEAYQSGLEAGDLEFAAIAAGAYAYTAFYTGENLAELERQMTGYRQALRQLKQTTLFYYYGISHQTVRNLLQPSATPDRLAGEAYDEAEMLPVHLRENDRTGLYLLYHTKMVLSFLFGRYERMLEYAARAEEYLDGVVGLLLVPLFHFYDSMARLALYPTLSKAEQKAALRKVAANQSKLKHWAEFAPMNHLAEFHLVEAELARLSGDPEATVDHYLRTLILNQEQRFINKAAIAHELMAKFYLGQGQEEEARSHLLEAHYSYTQWGAAAKVRHLEESYPVWLKPAPSEPAPAEVIAPVTSPVTTRRHHSDTLDMAAVQKALRLKPGEIKRSTLLEYLTRAMMENSGAGRGVLILGENGAMVVEIEGTTQANQVAITWPALLLKAAANNFLPGAILNYVARTGETVILSDASPTGRFGHEPYLTLRQPKSILCLPLKQGRLQGMMYLENNLAAGVFTPERLKFLNLLVSQAAAALEQAPPEPAPGPSLRQAQGPAPEPVKGTHPEPVEGAREPDAVPPTSIVIPETGFSLTPREFEVLELIAQGVTNRTIAEQLVITMPTVKTHITHILTKLNVSSRTKAIRRARQLGILKRDE